MSPKTASPEPMPDTTTPEPRFASRDLPIPRNPWLKRARFGLLSEGLGDGSAAIECVFTGTGGTDPRTTMEILEVLIATPMPRSAKVVRLVGPYAPGDGQMLFFTAALVRYGFQLQAVLRPEDGYPQWLENVHWRILRTPEPRAWIDFNEFWYVPLEGTPLVDPQVPDSPNARFMYLNRVHSVNATLEFFATSAFRWLLI